MQSMGLCQSEHKLGARLLSLHRNAPLLANTDRATELRLWGGFSLLSQPLWLWFLEDPSGLSEYIHLPDITARSAFSSAPAPASDLSLAFWEGPLLTPSAPCHGVSCQHNMYSFGQFC